MTRTSPTALKLDYKLADEVSAVRRLTLPSGVVVRGLRGRFPANATACDKTCSRRSGVSGGRGIRTHEELGGCCGAGDLADEDAASAPDAEAVAGRVLLALDPHGRAAVRSLPVGAVLGAGSVGIAGLTLIKL
jgi:hypothetical protein